MSKKAALLFVSLFLMVIYAIPAVQSVIDIRKKKSVQPLHFFEDTFVTPYRRVNNLASIVNDTLLPGLEELEQELRKAEELEKRAASDEEGAAGEEIDEEDASTTVGAGEEELNPWAETDVFMKADDLRWLVSRLQRKDRQKNRHIQDKESLPHYSALDELEEKLEHISEIADDEGDIAEARGLLDEITGRGDWLKQQYRKRGILSIPGLSVQAFLTHTFFAEHYIREYESEMEDNSIFAETFRPWVEYGRFILLKDGGSKGIVGKDGWYFYQPGFDFLVRPHIYDKRTMVVDYNDVALTESPIGRIVGVRDELKAHGIDLVVVIVPGKPSVYPELLSPRFQSDSVCVFSHSLKLISELREEGVDIVNLFDPFLEEKKRDKEAGDALYLRKDTHWRARGLMVAARETARHIMEYDWYEPGDFEYIVDTMVVDRRGDIAEMIKLPRDSLPGLQDYSELEPTTCYQVQRVFRGEDSVITRKVPFRRHSARDKFRSPILVMGDSFSRIYQSDEPQSAGWISHLGRNLKYPVEEIVNDGGASTLVREMLSRKILEYREEKNKDFMKYKKVVVWEVIERDFRFGAEGWKYIPLFAEAE